jgi:hypothetical protein
VSDCGICLFIYGSLDDDDVSYWNYVALNEKMIVAQWTEGMWKEVGDWGTVLAFAKEMRKTV